ncbi:diguanylate cyclase [Gammaproteobacteria bacterium]
MSFESLFSSRFFQAIVENSPDMIVIVDEEGRIVFVNNRCSTLLGYEQDELIGKDVEILVPEEFRNHKEMRDNYQNNPVLKEMGNRPFLVAMHKSGTRVPVDISLNSLRSDGSDEGHARLVQAVMKDAMPRWKIQQDLHRISRTDLLTGAWNRRHFDEVVENELERSRRYGYPISLMLTDIDNFKDINDSHGHSTGDLVLVRVTDLMRMLLRKSDLLTRWGGEEFVVLMPNTTLSNAGILAERMREVIASHHIDDMIHVTASMGVAEYIPSESREHWIGRADIAMYKAKRAGRNRVEIDATQTTLPQGGEWIDGTFAHLLWKEHFLSGNRIIDVQHQGLFNDANQLLSAMLSGQPADDLCMTADVLVRDMIQHFQDEEAILMAVGYPEVKAHADLHRKLIEKACTLVDRFRAGALEVGELFQFLAYDVVARHLLSADRKFFPYLAIPGSPT